jgi:hypothetical protein
VHIGEALGVDVKERVGVIDGLREIVEVGDGVCEGVLVIVVVGVGV